MSIQRPDAFAGLAAGEQGSATEHTALIAALFRENLQPSKGLKVDLPVTVPSKVAGVASPLQQPAQPLVDVGSIIPGVAISTSGSAPAQTSSSATANRDIGLNGGFPGATDTVPPVHPTVVAPESESESTKKASPKPAAPSGTHQLNDVSSYEFGEPRFVMERLNTRPQEPPGGTDWTSLQQTLPFASHTVWATPASTEPDYYFLPKSAVPASASAQPLSTFDVEAVRRHFPALHQRVNGHRLIYLDNAATTHKPQSVIDATSQFYGRDNSNIHRAAHVLAERSTKLFEEGREKVRQFLGAADAKEIVFVRGTTEAINLVANSYGRKHIGRGDEILLTKLEHHANIVPWQLLAEQTGAVIRVAPINDRGELILEEFAKLLNHRTKIVSVTHVSNALGSINPVEQIIPLAHAVGAVVLVDGAQSTPHLPVNVQALDADFYVFSGHKVFGPTGIGALYGKRHLLESMPPWQGGGHMIQDVTFEKTVYRPAPEKFEAGTPDIAGVVGLGAAIDFMFRVGIPAIAAYEHALLEYAMHALATVPGLKPIGTAHHKASVFSFIMPGLTNESIANQLDQKGIAVRAGHHCALPAQRHFGQDTTVRPSLAFYNTYEEVDILVSELRRLRR